MVAWRAAGINYVRFSQLAAQVVRNCTKGVKDAKKTSTSTLKVTAWEAGKPAPVKSA